MGQLFQRAPQPNFRGGASTGQRNPRTGNLPNAQPGQLMGGQMGQQQAAMANNLRNFMGQRQKQKQFQSMPRAEQMKYDQATRQQMGGPPGAQAPNQLMRAAVMPQTGQAQTQAPNQMMRAAVMPQPQQNQMQRLQQQFGQAAAQNQMGGPRPMPQPGQMPQRPQRPQRQQMAQQMGGKGGRSPQPPGRPMQQMGGKGGRSPQPPQFGGKGGRSPRPPMYGGF